MIDAAYLLLQGAGVSLILGLAGIVFGTLIGALLTPFSFSRWPLFKALYQLLVFLVRGTPLLVQALLVFYTLPAFDLRLGPYLSGVIVISIYTGAFLAEVFRGGVIAIPKALLESSRSLGLPPFAILQRVILPLAVRYSLPAYVNVCVMTIKASSVLSIISVWELTLAAREIVERTLWVFSTLGAAAVLYFVMCLAIDRLGRHMERRLLAKGRVGVHT